MPGLFQIGDADFTTKDTYAYLNKHFANHDITLQNCIYN